MSVTTLFRNAAVLDTERGELHGDQAVLVVDDRIAEVGTVTEVRSANPDRVVDARGRTLLPGLIDAHVHVYVQSMNLTLLESWLPSYLVPKAAKALGEMLQRGFTTVRDVGGADFALAQAIEEGLVVGPRLVHGGPALSQTGGHGDFRSRGSFDAHGCLRCPTIFRLADGPDEVRRVARDVLRGGAHHLKLMLSGGVLSPTDSISSVQYTSEEIAVAVREASAAGKYVTGHTFLADAINSALRQGVRCIEHGNFIDDTSVDLFNDYGAFLVPTLTILRAIDENGPGMGLSEEVLRKSAEVFDAGLTALERAQRGGVNIVYGTDLLGDLQTRQLEEFTLRAEVQPLPDLIRSATATPARLLGMAGDIGVIAPGAYADLLIVDGDPLTDISVLTKPERYLNLVMKAGTVYYDAL
jgi:imidazolonepropionase-like amidohydrolase